MTELNDNNGSRTHEPNLRELTAQLDDLRELVATKFESVAALSTERDRRYEQRFSSSDTAVQAALAAQKEGTAAAFAASEKAIVKAEIAQQNYNDRSNEFRQALDDSNKANISRNEADTRFAALTDKIEDLKIGLDKADKELAASIGNLRETRSTNEGRSLGSAAVIAFIISGISVVGALIAIFFALSGR